MNFAIHGINKGKIVYWIDGHRFENSEGKHDGMLKAEQYCLDNFLNPSNIQKFDSRVECNRYEYLLNQQRLGLISNLGHHFKIRIQEEFTNANGDVIPPIVFEADFIYSKDGIRVVEDVKGSEYFIDERFITIKQVFDKMMLDKGLYIKVVLFRNNEWVEWRIGEKKKSQKLIKKQREELKSLRKERHDKEVAERKETRERERYIILRDMASSGGKLNKTQKKRLDELSKKFEV